MSQFAARLSQCAQIAAKCTFRRGTRGTFAVPCNDSNGRRTMMLFSISDSVQRAFTVFFAWIPRFAGALLVLVIGYFVAKLVAKLLFRVLQRAGLDRTLHSGQGGNFVQRVTDSPSGLLGRIAFWAIFLGAVSLAASVLGIAALTGFVAAIWAYIPNVIAALAIFLVAGAISAAVAGF